MAFDDDKKACLPLPALQSRPLVSVGLLCGFYLYLVCSTRQSSANSPAERGVLHFLAFSYLFG